ncbi:hypothetical protein J6590_012455 [Homalodisca vitripennis]|nr:hypothetical protein J6590_012455 [Homalodisca vitripennis]
MDESDIDDALDDDFSDRSLTDFSVSGSEYMPSDEESDVTSAEELNEENGVVSDLDELELMEVDEEYQRVREGSGDEEGNNNENVSDPVQDVVYKVHCGYVENKLRVDRTKIGKQIISIHRTCRIKNCWPI